MPPTQVPVPTKRLSAEEIAKKLVRAARKGKRDRYSLAKETLRTYSGRRILQDSIADEVNEYLLENEWCLIFVDEGQYILQSVSDLPKLEKISSF